MGNKKTKQTPFNYRKYEKVARELRDILKDKTILGMYKWVKEHSDYLIYFENYNERAIAKAMNMYGEVIAILHQHDSDEARDDCLLLSIRTVIELETNCR